MNQRVAIDASVLIKLFAPRPERHFDQAAALVDQWERGDLELVAPAFLLRLELLNVAGRKWKFAQPALDVLSSAIDAFDMDERPVDFTRVTRWIERGLSTYDAAYVEVAESANVNLITDDDQIVEVAPSIARRLADIPLM